MKLKWHSSSSSQLGRNTKYQSIFCNKSISFNSVKHTSDIIFFKCFKFIRCYNDGGAPNFTSITRCESNFAWNDNQRELVYNRTAYSPDTLTIIIPNDHFSSLKRREMDSFSTYEVEKKTFIKLDIGVIVYYNIDSLCKFFRKKRQNFNYWYVVTPRCRDCISSMTLNNLGMNIWYNNILYTLNLITSCVPLVRVTSNENNCLP